nr:hypothetical protein [Halovivax sp. TS33]
MAELEMARGVRGVAQEVNLDSSPDLDGVNSTLETNSEAFVRQYGNATAERRPAVVNLSAIGANESARAINSNTIDDNILGSGPREIGHFSLELESGSVDEVEITATDSSGSDTISVRRENDELVITPDGSSDCRFEHNGDPIVFDFTDDTIIGATIPDCSIKLIEPTNNYTDISINDHGDADGGYELVARGNTNIGGDRSGHPAAWTVDLEYTYDTSELSVEREFEVDVYGDRR